MFHHLYKYNLWTPYNEFLLFLTEHGLPGIGLILILIYEILTRHNSSPTNDILKSTLISFWVFSCFSYPSQVGILISSLIFILGVVESRTVLTIFIPFKWFPLMIVFVLALISYPSYQLNRRCEQDIIRLLTNHHKENNLSRLKIHYRKIHHNPKLMDALAQYCAQSP